MAPMRFLQRAAALGTALLVAGCAASSGDAPASDAASGDAATGGVADAEATEATLALAVQPKIPIADDGLRQLAAMSGPLGDDGVFGAGCDAEEGAPLPDGDYYGTILEYSTSLVTIDIACVYGPDTAQFAAFAEATETANQSYAVVNHVAEERPVLFSDVAEVYLEHLDWKPVDVGTAAAALDPGTVGEHRCAWVRVEGGEVIALVEPVAQGAAAS